MTWVHAWPALLLALAVLILPGLAISLALGLRREPAVGVAPMLSISAVAAAIPLSRVLHLRWGLVPVALATAVLVVLSLAAWAASRRWWRWGVRRDPEATERRATTDLVIFLLTAAVGAAWVGALMVYVIGDIRSPNQTFDGVFHMNAVLRAADLGSAQPLVISETSDSTGSAPFYPSLFHGVAALLVMRCGVTAAMACNIVSVLVSSVVWSLSSLFLVHVMLPRHRFGALSAVVPLAAIPLFPYLLSQFGVLWPNQLGIAVLPAVLACIVVLLGEAPQRTVPWVGALVAVVISLAGLYYAHPGCLFAAGLLALPVAAGAILRLAGRIWRTYRFGPAWSVLMVLAIVLAVRQAWVFALDLPQLKGIVGYNWPATMTIAQALGDALALGTPLSPSTWLVGTLTVLGAIQAMRHPRQRWLVIAHGVMIYLYMLAAGTDEKISQDLTGFWYNDQYRIAAMLPITAVPLVAIGLVWVRDGLLASLDAWLRERRGGSDKHRQIRPSGSLRWQWGVGVAALAAVTLALPGGVGLKDPSSTLREGYYPSTYIREQIDPDERHLYEQVLTPSAGDHLTVIGNPWNGSALVGPLTGREPVFRHTIMKMDADRTLLRERFRDFATDPAVCAAVQRLHVGYAIDDPKVLWPDDAPRRPYSYPGVTGLAGVKGLTRVASERDVIIYRVEACRGG